MATLQCFLRPVKVKRALARLLAAALVAAAILPAAPATAASFAVTKAADTNDGACNADCSLREAIIAANAAAGPDTITLPAGTYNFAIAGQGEDAAATGDLDITSEVTILGAGADVTIIDAQDLDRVFHVTAAGNLRLSGVTVRNGAAGAGAGGGIANSGTLALSHSAVVGSSAAFGGGIYNEGPSVTIANSTIVNNQGGYGGGIYNKNGALHISAGALTANSASTRGGGLNNFVGGNVVITATLVSGNSAGQSGGGLANEYGTAQIRLTSSTVVSNSAASLTTVYGGGIYNIGFVTAVNSTIGSNSAYAWNTCSLFTGCSTSYTSYGGGIYNSGTLALTNATLSFNSATAQSILFPVAGSGGAIRNLGSATLKNTIVASSTVFLGEMNNCSNTTAITSQGYNLDTGTTCGFGAAGDKTGVDPRLDLLQTIGGSTPLYPLRPGSPAIEGGTNTGCPSADQRGLLRPFDADRNGTATCDIGAFEYGFRFVLPLALRNYPPEYTAPCEQEPNDSRTDANGPIISGRSYCGGNTGGGTDNDFFSFNKASGGTVVVSVTGLGSSGQVRLLNALGNQVGYAGGAPFQISCGGAPCAAAGPYYVQVVTTADQGSQQYTLVVTFP